MSFSGTYVSVYGVFFACPVIVFRSAGQYSSSVFNALRCTSAQWPTSASWALAICWL